MEDMGNYFQKDFVPFAILKWWKVGGRFATGLLTSKFVVDYMPNSTSISSLCSPSLGGGKRPIFSSEFPT
jgi:hypothetical protein